jgi:DNA-binding NarL/FixJ family response regulator
VSEEAPPIRVVVVDDHAAVRAGLERVRTDDIAETLRIDRREALRRARRVIGMLRSSRDLVGV